MALCIHAPSISVTFGFGWSLLSVCVTARPKKRWGVTSGCAKPHLLEGQARSTPKVVTHEESATVSEGEGEGVARE